MRLRNAASITERQLQWLWPGMIPLQQDTLVEGDPGTAKSTFTLSLAAHVSRGEPWPDGMPCPKGHALIANAEDPDEEVIIPRLKAAGADLNNITTISPSDKIDDIPFTIPESVPWLEAKVRELKLPMKLMVFDPLEAFLSVGVNNYSNHHVRHALRALELMAQRLNCAVILVRHLNKSTDKAAIYRGGGSIGIIGAARAALSVGRDPANKDRCIVVPVKQNWTKMRGGIAYKPTEYQYHLETGELITTSRVVWDGEVACNADDIISAEPEAAAIGQIDETAQFLRDELMHGPIDATELLKRGQDAGLSRKTMWRASRLLGVLKHREGFGPDSHFVWSLPTEEESAGIAQFAGIKIAEDGTIS